MKKFLYMILILSSCSTEPSIKNQLNFSDDMSFNEFKRKLQEYSKNNPYPNINN